MWVSNLSVIVIERLIIVLDHSNMRHLIQQMLTLNSRSVVPKNVKSWRESTVYELKKNSKGAIGKVQPDVLSRSQNLSRMSLKLLPWDFDGSLKTVIVCLVPFAAIFDS